jgi:hypothetical protein
MEFPLWSALGRALATAPVDDGNTSHQAGHRVPRVYTLLQRPHIAITRASIGLLPYSSPVLCRAALASVLGITIAAAHSVLPMGVERPGYTLDDPGVIVNNLLIEHILHHTTGSPALIRLPRQGEVTP